MLAAMFAKSMAQVEAKAEAEKPQTVAIPEPEPVKEPHNKNSEHLSDCSSDSCKDAIPDQELIVSNKVDMSNLFGGGGAKKISYKMEYVPLKLGVKINPEDKYYGDEAVKSYKDKAANLF